MTKYKVLVGIGIGYEKLTSKVTLDSSYDSFARPDAVNGKVTITNAYITINLFLGCRILKGPVTLDALAGVERAYHQTGLLEKAALTAPNPYTARLEKRFHNRPATQGTGKRDV